MNMSDSGVHQVERFLWLKEAGNDDKLIMCLCVCPKVAWPGQLGSFTLRWVSVNQSNTGIVSVDFEASMTRWVSVSIYLCKTVLETIAVMLHFTQGLLRVGPVSPPRLAERGHDRVIRQPHLPQLPRAIPQQPGRSVEHHSPTGPSGETLLHTLQRGAVLPVWIRLHPGTCCAILTFHYHWCLRLAHQKASDPVKPGFGRGQWNPAILWWGREELRKQPEEHRHPVSPQPHVSGF